MRIRGRGESFLSVLQSMGLLPIFGVNDPALWHSLAHFSPNGAFSSLPATARNKKEKPLQYVTVTALKSGAEGGRKKDSSQLGENISVLISKVFVV